MPGPRNPKKKRKGQQAAPTQKKKQSPSSKKSPGSQSTRVAVTTTSSRTASSSASGNSCPSSPPIATPSPPQTRAGEQGECRGLVQLLHEQCILSPQGDDHALPPVPHSDDRYQPFDTQALVHPVHDQSQNAADAKKRDNTGHRPHYHVGDIPQEPYIHDPGNGPRVKNMRLFLTSYFAQPPCPPSEDALCAEFGKEEVLHMLCTALPEELAMILWYNKSRLASRVCPACRRLYRLGDDLPMLAVGASPEDSDSEDHTTPRQESSVELTQEQYISGLCSPLCFVLASFNYPAAISRTWGRTCDEIEDEVWEMLNSPIPTTPAAGVNKDGSTSVTQQSQGDVALSMLVRMTRLPDIGLGQLFFPGEELDGDDEQQFTHEDYDQEDDERPLVQEPVPLQDQDGVD